MGKPHGQVAGKMMLATAPTIGVSGTGGWGCQWSAYVARSILTHDYQALALVVVSLGDLVAVFCAGLAADRISPVDASTMTLSHWALTVCLVAVVACAAGAICGGYPLLDRRGIVTACRNAGLGCVAVFAALIAFESVPGVRVPLSGPLLVIWLSGSMAGVVAMRLGFATAVRLGLNTGLYRKPVALIGATPVALQLARRFDPGLRRPIKLLGVFDDRGASREDHVPRVDGTISELISLVQAGAVAHILLTLPASASQRIDEIVDRLRSLAVDVTLVRDDAKFATSMSVDAPRAGAPAQMLLERPLKGSASFLKALQDKVVSAAMLVLFAPLMAVIALAIRLESEGPIIFRQERYGLNNRTMMVFKFRTMHHAATDHRGARQVSVGDTRVTRVGRFLRRSSLDELPQLFNVLRGDMSIVGPRPHPLGMLTEGRLCEEIVPAYACRHRVRPGLTGWAQIHGFRGPVLTVKSLEERIKYDNYYIENISLLMDLKILLLTPVHILFSSEAM